MLIHRGDTTIRLRRGLDKVTLAFLPEKVTMEQFSRKKAKALENWYTNMKFGKKYIPVVQFLSGSWDGTPLIHYWAPLKGVRRILVMVNMMRLYNYDNGLDAPRRISLWDNNLVPPDEDLDLKHFCSMLIELKEQLADQARRLFAWVYDRPIGEYQISVLQAEFAEEAIGLDMLDIKEVYRHTKAFKTVRFSNSTGTVYLNGPENEQLKFYQKGLGVLRAEWTLNNSDTLSLESAEELHYSIMHRARAVATQLGVERHWWKLARFPRKDTLYKLLASTLGIDADLLRRVIDCDTWESTADNELTTRKLRRRKLVERVKRGVYAPTRKLQLFKKMIDSLEDPP